MSNLFLLSWTLSREALRLSIRVLILVSKYFFISFLLALVASPLLPSAEAKDMPQRLGVGVKNNASFDMPALAAIYYPNRDVGVTLGLGIDTKKDESRSSFDLGARRIIFREQNMNFHFGGMLAVVNFEQAGEKSNGFDVNALFGVEFFFSGLENLGFNMEGGVGVSSLKNTRFRTISDHPLRAGIIFYF
jgi:hypothetical protein